MNEENREEEDSRESEESALKKRKKAQGIGAGLGLGLLFEIVGFALFAMFPSAAWGFLLVLYIVIIFVCCVKAEDGVGLGLILALCIPFLIFGGCLLLLISEF